MPQNSDREADRNGLLKGWARGRPRFWDARSVRSRMQDIAQYMPAKGTEE